MEGITDLAELLAGLEPSLSDGEFVFLSIPDNAGAHGNAGAPWAVIREDEGTTLILERPPAEGTGKEEGETFRRITLTVHSSLAAVGLTAAVSRALAEAGIPANVVAGFHHDHIFVPAGRAGEALAVLEALSQGSPPLRS